MFSYTSFWPHTRFDFGPSGVEALPIDSDMSDHALILFSLEVMRPHEVKKTITFRSYRNVDNNSIVNIKHILNILDVSSLTAEDCTIWYNNFF